MQKMEDYDQAGGSDEEEEFQGEVEWSRPIIYNAVQGCNRSNCCKSGFLEKRSRNRGTMSFMSSTNWTKRFVRFHEDLTIQYWLDDVIKGEIKLNPLSTMTKIDSAQADGKPNAFTISNGTETMIFSAELPEMVDEWIAAVTSMINLPKKLERITRLVGFSPQQPVVLDASPSDLDMQVTVSEWCEGKSYTEVFYNVYLTCLAKELEMLTNRDKKAAEKLRAVWRSRKLILRSSMSKLSSGTDHCCSFTSSGHLLIEFKHARTSVEPDYLYSVFSTIQYLIYPNNLAGVLKDFDGTGEYKMACNNAFVPVMVDAEQGTMTCSSWQGDYIQRIQTILGWKTLSYNVFIINYSSGHGFRSSSNMDEVLDAVLGRLCIRLEQLDAAGCSEQMKKVFAEQCNTKTIKLRCNLEDSEPPKPALFYDGFLRFEFPKHIANCNEEFWSLVFPPGFDAQFTSSPSDSVPVAENAALAAKADDAVPIGDVAVVVTISTAASDASTEAATVTASTEEDIPVANGPVAATAKSEEN